MERTPGLRAARSRVDRTAASTSSPSSAATDSAHQASSQGIGTETRDKRPPEHEERFDADLNLLATNENEVGHVSGFAPHGDIHRVQTFRT